MSSVSKAVFHPGVSGYFLFPLRCIFLNLYRLYFPFSVISKRISQKRKGLKYFTLKTLPISENVLKAQVGIRFADVLCFLKTMKMLMFPQKHHNLSWIHKGSITQQQGKMLSVPTILTQPTFFLR